MPYVLELPVVKIVQLLISSENNYMYFICCLSGCGMSPQPFKILLNNCKGLVVFAVSCPVFPWSGLLLTADVDIYLCLIFLFIF